MTSLLSRAEHAHGTATDGVVERAADEAVSGLTTPFSPVVPFTHVTAPAFVAAPLSHIGLRTTKLLLADDEREPPLPI